MPEPFRLLVLKSLTKVLEKTSYADYPTMEGRVFRGRLFFGEDDPLPMLSILEPPIPIEAVRSQADNVKSASSWELLVQGFVNDDRSNPSDPAHCLMAETKKALVAEKRRNSYDFFGYGVKDAKTNNSNSITSLQIGQGAVRPADEHSGVGFFWLSIILGITENLENPYL